VGEVTIRHQISAVIIVVGKVREVEDEVIGDLSSCCMKYFSDLLPLKTVVQTNISSLTTYPSLRKEKERKCSSFRQHVLAISTET
jgi:hypothetical protein